MLTSGLRGDDAAADHVLSCLRAEGIDASRVRRAYGPNGEAVVTVNEEGDRIFVGTNRGVRVTSLLKLQLTQDDLDYINGYDLIHTSVNSDLEHECPGWRINRSHSISRRRSGGLRLIWSRCVRI
ncbi:hypothetical protein LJK88_41990 [Paenibacillus sp. P26]|nr:hypothetical protein LJK88_41990 [Paenibacillus sp. P26]